MRPAEEINQLIKKIHLKASANLDKRVSESISSAQVKQEKPVLSKVEGTKAAYMSQNIRSKIMKNPFTKLAAAAVIIIAVLVISFPFSNSGVAWASLAEKIESINTVVFHLTTNTKMQGIPQEQVPKVMGIGYYSSEYGVRFETYMNDEHSFTMYLNPEKNVYVTVIPESKRFMKVIDKSQKELRQMAEKEDPRVMVRRMMLEEYKELGRDTINGIVVEGIECSGPRILGGMYEEGTARLWVEVGTDYPVRIELEGIVSDGQMEMSMVMDDFQWDVELDEALFIPEIPSDYKKQEMTVETSEEDAINGLRTFAELIDGRYPESLEFMSLMKEASEELTKKYGMEIIAKQDEYTSTLTDILKTAAFYTKLVGQGKDVVYYGDTVTTDNPDTLLMRWEIAKGVYRVIFGDLNTGDYTAEELAVLEN